MGDFYVEFEYWFAAFQLVMAMLGMGATLTARDFRDVVSEPKSVTLGLIVQIVIVPLVAFIFLRGLGVSGGVAIGIALIAAIPGGTTSNILPFLPWRLWSLVGSLRACFACFACFACRERTPRR